MQILTINLAKKQSDAIVCELGEIVCCAGSLDEAYKLIQNEDFTIIVYGIPPQSTDPGEIATLVGLTLMTTRILVVGDPDQLSGCEDWRELGLELVANPTDEALMRRIRTNQFSNST